jgi:hypothetical protein
MVTRLTYSMTRGEDGYVARCEELSVESTGGSPEMAIGRLRKAIEQELTSVEAVGPPSRPPAPPIIELVAKGAGQIQPERDPQGPGDSPAAQRS